MVNVSPGLGRIFLSHSSADKSFVRKLVRKLEDEGYDVWLDEKELLVGDALVTHISHAINEAKVVLVVVSQTSIRSQWLSFELNAATQRMISGGCRVLPVLISDVEPPPEMQGLVYADCRPGRRGCMAKILETLAFEASRYPKAPPASLDSDDGLSRQRALRVLVEELFGPRGYAMADLSATRSVDWDFITVMQDDGSEAEVLIDEVIDHVNDRRPLTENDWADFREWVHEDCGVPCAILLSELPLGPEVADLMSSEATHLYYIEDEPRLTSPDRATVAVDLSGRPSEEETRARLGAAQTLLKRLVDRLSPSLLKGTLGDSGE